MRSCRRIGTTSCYPEGALRAAGLRVTIVLFVASALMVSSLVAQVGHPPRSSPYRDIRKGHTVTVLGGYFSGNGGQFNIGPHDAAVFGVRYDVRTGGTIQFGLGIAHGNLKRFIVDPFVPLANRKTGPVRQSVTFADVTLQFNITGGKSWHRIAPFVAASGGLALTGDTSADTSGYDFGRKFYFAPGAGVRVFLSDRLHLRAEAKATFWKLNYPATFQSAPVAEPATPALITDGKLTEWTTSSWLQIGLGYSFSP